MPFSTIGDLRQHLLTSQSNTRLKTELSTLVEELTTGEYSDLTAHLGSSQTALNGLDRQLALLEKYEQVNTQTSHMLSTMQSVLENVDTLRTGANETLLTIGGASSPSQMSNASDVALASFEATVSALNTRYGDRSLFGGTNIEDTPLADAEIMLTDLKASLAGLSTAVDISAAIDAWFDDAGGGFDTVGYQGDTTGFIEKPLDTNQNITVTARADDEALRETFKSFAKGIVATESSLNLSIEESRDLQQESAIGLLNSAEMIASFQSSLGFVESRVEEAIARNTAEQTSFGIARNELVSADPFETVTRLESVQLQLETQYTLTARLSSLSLTEYLR
ncbi:flagellin [Octadecabacter sp.]|nr:flagellin [Octadecabacter sp.]